MNEMVPERLQDVVQKALGSCLEHAGFALFGVIALDNAHAAKSFGEAAGDFRVDLAPLPENGADGFEGALQHQAEGDQDQQHKRSHGGAGAEEQDGGDRRGEQAAGEFD